MQARLRPHGSHRPDTREYALLTMRRRSGEPAFLLACLGLYELQFLLSEEHPLSDQLSLFAAKSLLPEGLRYAAEFISADTEKELIAHIAALPLQPFQFGQYEGKRRVVSFGYRYDYTLRRLQEAEPIPSWLKPVIAKVESFGGPNTDIAQILCTEYDTGVGIGWHRDKPQFDRVFGLSLGSPCRFRFRRPAGSKWERFTLNAEPRSLYMMSGPSRSEWEHSIPAVEALRYSITFRTMRENA
jgi:alkylated DNA repair dioxygenase AlkB